MRFSILYNHVKPDQAFLSTSAQLPVGGWFSGRCAFFVAVALLLRLGQATHGQFVQKKTLAEFDKLEKEIKAWVTWVTWFASTHFFRPYMVAGHIESQWSGETLQDLGLQGVTRCRLMPVWNISHGIISDFALWLIKAKDVEEIGLQRQQHRVFGRGASIGLHSFLITLWNPGKHDGIAGIARYSHVDKDDRWTSLPTSSSHC